jgi:hypothetical protein
MGTMKRHPLGMFQVCSDGVLRSFDGPSTRNVIDAVGLSPSQIKGYLDTKPWTQEAEDKFRGVDGRKVVDYQALFHPPDELRPKKMTEEEVKKQTAEIEEKNRMLRERIQQEEADGVNVEEKYACGNRVISNYDLSVKNNN